MLRIEHFGVLVLDLVECTRKRELPSHNIYLITALYDFDNFFKIKKDANLLYFILPVSMGQGRVLIERVSEQNDTVKGEMYR